MSNKLIIPFDGKSKAEVDAGGVFSFIGFERLRALLNNYMDIDEETEAITGLRIDESGIDIRIDTKAKP